MDFAGELCNEIHRWVKSAWQRIEAVGADERAAAKYCESVRAFLQAAAQVWGEVWGNADSMVTKPVALKAMLRVCADQAPAEGEPAEGRVKRWGARLAPWAEQVQRVQERRFPRAFPG